MKKFRELMLANKAWSREMRERKHDFFGQQLVGENPDIFWIGPSDSRVSPEQITQTRPGEMFIHRNLGNIVAPEDDNFGSALQHAVEELTVSHIVICGHLGCSGVASAIRGGTSGAIDRWLQPVRDVAQAHASEIEAAASFEDKAELLVGLNVRHQLGRLSKMPVVRRAFERGQDLTLHGLVYDLRTGLVNELEFESETEARLALVN